MREITITEALAEIKTLNKRIMKKQDLLLPFITRRADRVDPLLDKGGSKVHVASEFQSLRDLMLNVARIRTAIHKKNLETGLTLGGVNDSIQGWLNWRREVAPLQERLLRSIAAQLPRRSEQGEGVDVVVNLDEQLFASLQEQHVSILGALDGKLSLLNATTLVEVPD